MIDFTSTPIILTMMLGSVGVIIPVISVARKEKGSSLYGGIAFAALISAISFVGYQTCHTGSNFFKECSS